MAFEGSTCWLITAGRRARHAEEFVRSGVVATGFDLPDVGDLDVVDDPEIFLALQGAGRRKPEEDLGDLRRLQSRLAVGDVVVVADTAADDLVLGEVTGAYAYADPPVAGTLAHTRPVRWLGRITSSEVDSRLVGHTRKPRAAVGRLPEEVHWLRLAEEVDDFRGRPADDIPVRARRTRRTTSSAGGARTRRSSTPTPAPVPDRICPGCGLLLAPSLFEEGQEYCRDCA